MNSFSPVKLGIDRLKSSRQFRQVYDQGRKFSDPYFHLFVLEISEEKIKFGVTVTRRIGKAVQRNRVKRKFRESFRLLAPYLTKGYSIVMIARRPSTGVSTPELMEHLKYQLQQSGIMILNQMTKQQI